MHGGKGIMKAFFFFLKSVFLYIISYVKNECGALHSCAHSKEVFTDLSPQTFMDTTELSALKKCILEGK